MANTLFVNPKTLAAESMDPSAVFMAAMGAATTTAPMGFMLTCPSAGASMDQNAYSTSTVVRGTGGWHSAASSSRAFWTSRAP